ncbi:hypothetical protein [Actinomadura sp. DC4]|uniref:hypothetical protein n=1 Tax=Actinomadura sp. DC4 TaxID=3055069 RepID=UPI0025AFF7B4|nr:hypothetical protein [Actinomadura sp. DC4]MDN3354327.1 hypothetical protein [Actinomadura sp. DC4]
MNRLLDSITDAPSNLRRCVFALALAIAATTTMSITAAWTAHAGTGTPASAKLTCVSWEGAATLDWDVLVQLNPDGTAKSAEQQGDPYMVGPNIWSVQRADPAEVTITNGGRNLHFHGSGLVQTGLPGTDFVLNGVPAACSADFTFPNPHSPVINPEPIS